MFLPAELERGTKVLQFDVCCEANEQNFDYGCKSKKMLRKFALVSKSKQINYNTGNLELLA